MADIRQDAEVLEHKLACLLSVHKLLQQPNVRYAELLDPIQGLFEEYGENAVTFSATVHGHLLRSHVDHLLLMEQHAHVIRVLNHGKEVRESTLCTPGPPNMGIKKHTFYLLKVFISP